MIAMAVNAIGGKAVSLSGATAGIVTDGVHTKAKISHISPRQINELLAEDYIVVVAGFQGQSREGAITTLGRGGSDLTAIAGRGPKGGRLPDLYRCGRRAHLRSASRARREQDRPDRAR